MVLRGHEDQVWAVAISPDSHWVVTGSRTARLWLLQVEDLIDLARISIDEIFFLRNGSSIFQARSTVKRFKTYRGRIRNAKKAIEVIKVFTSKRIAQNNSPNHNFAVTLRIIWHKTLRAIWHSEALQKEREILPRRSTCEGYQNSSQGCYFKNIISRMIFEKRKSLNLEIW